MMTVLSALLTVSTVATLALVLPLPDAVCFGLLVLGLAGAVTLQRLDRRPSLTPED